MINDQKKIYIDNLINKMIDEKLLTTNGMWLGHSEAKKLNDSDLIPYFEVLISVTKNKKTKNERIKREVYYFVLNWIGINTNDVRVPEVFMNRLPLENNIHIIEMLLDYIRMQKEYIPDYTKIITYIYDKRWQVKRPTIDLLGKCKEEKVENVLIEELEKTSDTYIVGDICNSLSKIGSKKSIPILVSLYNSNNQWNRCSSIEALISIGDESTLPIIMQALEDSFSGTRQVALLGICKFGNEKNVDLVYDKVIKIFSKKRMISSKQTTTDLIEGIKFLERYLDDSSKMIKIFSKIKLHWQLLYDIERDWIEKKKFLLENE